MPQRRNRRSGVEDRWRKASGEPSAANGQGLRWRARYVDEDGREHSRGFHRKAEAQQWLDTEVTAKFATGSYIDPQRGKVTLASFYKEWSTRQVWESSTRHVMDKSVSSVTFGNVGLGQLLPSHAEAWIKTMHEQELQPTTIRTRFVNVRGVIRAAVRERFLARDITENVRLPRTRKTSAAMSIPTAEEVGALLHVSEGWFTAYLAVCFFGGLRRGEASALQIGDWDFLRKELHVQRQVQFTDDGRTEVRGPKYGSERTVFVPERLVTIISEHIRCSPIVGDQQSWLFPSSIRPDMPVHAATVGRAWRALRGKVGIEHRLHDARHFFASGLIAAGCDVVTVQRALGHSSAAQTLTTYSHLWPDASDRTRKAAGDLLDLALGSTADALRTEAAKTPLD